MFRRHESMKGWGLPSNLQKMAHPLQQQTMAWKPVRPVLRTLPCKMTCPPLVRACTLMRSLQPRVL